MISSQNLSQSEGTWLGDCILRSGIYPILRGPDYLIILSSQKSIPFWGDLTMWLLFQPKNYPILKKPVYVIMISSQNFIPIWGDLTRWLYPKERNLSHSEGTWLCDHYFQLKIYPILMGTDYVIILFSQKSIPFRGDLTMWLYFPAKNLSHSEGTWLCDYYFSQKNIPFWKNLSMWLWFPAKNLSQSEGTWLGDCILRSGIYPILKGHDYVIILSSQKSIPCWGDLTMWLYIAAKNLSHSEGTWLYDCILRNEFYRILRRPDYVIILSSLKSIPFWGDLTMWLWFQPKKYPILKKPVYVIMISSQNLSQSEGTWLGDCILRSGIYPILRGHDYVIIVSSQKSIPFWGDLTIWLYP